MQRQDMSVQEYKKQVTGTLKQASSEQPIAA
jgi:hypothetical protein